MGSKIGMYKSGAAAGQLQLGLTSRKVEIYGILMNFMEPYFVFDAHH